MANQLNVNKYRTFVNVKLDTAAKMRTFVKGKTVNAESVGGRKIRKATRKMTVGDLLEQQADRLVSNVHMDAESRKWMNEQYEKNVVARSKADKKVHSGAYRKPKSEWLKPGRKPGKVYEKANAAMKELGKKRRAMTEAGKDWRKASKSK